MEKLPAILYVCGHADKGRNGNKSAYQSHGIWFCSARHVCLMLDSLQLGRNWRNSPRHVSVRPVELVVARIHACWGLNAGMACGQSTICNRVVMLIPSGLASPASVAADERQPSGLRPPDERSKWLFRSAVWLFGFVHSKPNVSMVIAIGMFLYNSFAWPWTRIAGLIALGR